MGQFSKMVATQMGLHFPKERWIDLERGITSAAREFGYQDTESCIKWLLSSPITKQQIEILADHLTIGETYFFREKGVFEAIRENILTEIFKQRQAGEKRIRIWSAGCSSGEEPYSVAILLSEMPDLRDWNISILATDINVSSLQKASQGIYNEWSFRDCPGWVKQKYFRQVSDKRYEINHEVKKLVTFGYHNLAQDAYPSLLNGTNAMDIILCRNVLMYFEAQKARQVTENYYQCLTEGGWLVVSPIEVSQVLYEKYHCVQNAGIFLFRKENQPMKIVLPQDNYHKVEATSMVVSPLISKLEAVRAKPKTIPLTQDQFDKALTFYRKGQFQKAELELTVLLSHHPTDARAMVLLARIQANIGKLTLAADYCQRGIASDKLNPLYYYILATIELEQRQTKAAVQSLKRALYVDQNFILAHFALGNLFRQSGRIAESQRYFANARLLLEGHPAEESVLEGEGITSGRLLEIIRALSSVETAA